VANLRQCLPNNMCQQPVVLLQYDWYTYRCPFIISS